jgi:hypothetical protein
MLTNLQGMGVHLGTDSLSLAMFDAAAMGGIQDRALSIAGAFVILLIGYVVALFASSLTRGLLKKTNLDEQLGSWISGKGKTSDLKVDQWLAAGVFWSILVFTLIAFLNALNLPMVAAPLTAFLNEITQFAPKIFGAAALAGVGWLLATIVKSVLTKGLDSFGVNERIASLTGDATASDNSGLNESLGNLLYWMILLLFLPAILGALELQGPLAPIQNMINELLSALPKLFKAGIIGVIGWFVAGLVKTIGSNFLAALGTDRVGESLGLTSSGKGAQSLSKMAGTLLYAIVLFFTAIQVLTELDIKAISGPALGMLNQVGASAPSLLYAGITLAVAFFIGRWVSTFVTEILSGLGFDNIPTALGLETMMSSARDLGDSPATSKSPSEIVGVISFVAIVLTGFFQAVQLLNFSALTALTGGLLAIAGQVLVGVIIFFAGLYAANLAHGLIAMPGTSQSNTLAQAAKVSILVLVGAMALQQMGIATNIVNLAFGLLAGGFAVAIALAFGLGGRDVAGEQLRDWIDSFKKG